MQLFYLCFGLRVNGQLTRSYVLYSEECQTKRFSMFQMFACFKAIFKFSATKRLFTNFISKQTI